ncbi:MAG: carbonic anhydrase family protein [Deltaproteobacteria bacterium]|nr:carbonic anhydrase family protein [Deltaproteobacteria bacterium]
MLILLFAMGCSHEVQDSFTAGHQSTVSVRPVHWGYGANDGPARWDLLSPAYIKCGQGRHQSPVDIVDPSSAKHSFWKAGYDSINIDIAPNEHVADIVDNGHTIQISGDKASTLVLGGKSYVLQQFHFHTPSEQGQYLVTK